MILQDIDIGTIADDGNGDNPREGAIKINANNALIASVLSGSVTGGALAGTEQLLGLDGGTNKAWLLSQVSTYIMALIVDSAPVSLNTLNELAAALGDDPNFATTVLNALAGKLGLGGGIMTGDIALGGSHRVVDSASPTSPGHLTTKDYVDTALGGKQPLDSDLTAIAALTTTAWGRALLTMADSAAARAALEIDDLRPPVVPTNGGTTNVPAGTAKELILVLNHTATIASHTINLPAMIDRQKFTVRSRSPITTVTLNPNSGTILNNLTSYSGGGHATWEWYAADSIFFRCD